MENTQFNNRSFTLPLFLTVEGWMKERGEEYLPEIDPELTEILEIVGTGSGRREIY